MVQLGGGGGGVDHVITMGFYCLRHERRGQDILTRSNALFWTSPSCWRSSSSNHGARFRFEMDTCHASHDKSGCLMGWEGEGGCTAAMACATTWLRYANRYRVR